MINIVSLSNMRQFSNYAFGFDGYIFGTKRGLLERIPMLGQNTLWQSENVPNSIIHEDMNWKKTQRVKNKHN